MTWLETTEPPTAFWASSHTESLSGRTLLNR